MYSVFTKMGSTLLLNLFNFLYIFNGLLIETFLVGLSMNMQYKILIKIVLSDTRIRNRSERNSLVHFFWILSQKSDFKLTMKAVGKHIYLEF